jgi:hypothetical protein
MDKATAQTRIDEIDSILASGVASASVNGRSVAYDLSALRKERSRLSGIVSGSPGSFRRVVFKVDA